MGNLEILKGVAQQLPIREVTEIPSPLENG